MIPRERPLKLRPLQTGDQVALLTLLIHPDKTIPVVWGILRSRLLASRGGAAVELANSCDPFCCTNSPTSSVATRWLNCSGQIACALHWFNPLVWFAGLASWRGT